MVNPPLIAVIGGVVLAFSLQPVVNPNGFQAALSGGDEFNDILSYNLQDLKKDVKIFYLTVKP